ncbi:unnamed protein product [Paramecium sonneborni]|uniref:Uncharacterized protein n=1 Tax=Paramecium sonneborni TaxID=65129 RepID=A0A8S1L6G5_9CILI|nr:unnamed protein product [Paramecium sonneborni]
MANEICQKSKDKQLISSSKIIQMIDLIRKYKSKIYYC